MNRRMNYINSDFNPTMAAVTSFNSIVQQVQASNLNYQLQLTPFTAKISLKKTHTKDRFGRPFQSEAFPHVNVRGLPKPPKPGTYREPGSVKFSKTGNQNEPGSPKN